MALGCPGRFARGFCIWLAALYAFAIIFFCCWSCSLCVAPNLANAHFSSIYGYFFSTLGLHLVTYLVLVFRGNVISFGDALALITLPSVFLNLLIALPIHSFIHDLGLWVYPLEEMV